MYRDPIVEEIHKFRQALSRRFNGDIHAICEHMRRQQAASGRKAVRLPPRPVRVRRSKAG